VVHACNPTSGGWRFKASWGKIIHETLSQKKKKSQKRAWGVAQGGGLEFKLQYYQKKKDKGKRK
jgi:hypothetical protein